MSAIEIKRNFDLTLDIQGALEAIDYNELSLRAISIILEKTASSVDYQNQPFVNYSEFYKQVREEKGLPTKPDLFFKGNMLSAITSDADNEGAVIGFLDRDSSNKAYQHVTGRGKLPVRDFFFINDDDMDDLTEIAMSFFDGKLQ